MSASHQNQWKVIYENNDGEEDSMTFWREERVEGALYIVYLKKVKYHTLSDIHEARPVHETANSRFYISRIDQNTSKEDVAHLQWRTQRIQVIKSGTLDRLVEAISLENGEIDSTYVNIFLATYRSFASPKQVLNLLLERYKSISKNKEMKQLYREANKKTIKSVISVWLDMYPEDFQEPPNYPCLQTLLTFFRSHMPESDLPLKAKHRLDKFKQEDEAFSNPALLSSQMYRFSLCDDVDFMMGSDYYKMMDFMSIPDKKMAEQLTYMDSELFKKVIPYHCLGSVWSRRVNKRGIDGSGVVAPSVTATVDQFNAVSYRVIATILKNIALRPSDRAVIMEKWIRIAQELRLMKNFSSLKAILSGLQSNPVYRLRKSWYELSRPALELYEELSLLFSEENNQLASRELLMKEGTAKFAGGDPSPKGHHRRKSGGVNAKRKSAADLPLVIQGTVPYLGTFLTDLTMIDTANPDITEDGLINFDKRRKEFEVIAQIKLLHSAASLYDIKPSRAFKEWFYSVRVYDDNESYDLSCEIEPVTPSTPQLIKGHRKKSSLGFFPSRRPSVDDVLSDSPSRSPCSTDRSSIASASSNSLSPAPAAQKELRHSFSVTSLKSVESDNVSLSPFSSPDGCIIKVCLDCEENHWTNVYKSILLSNSDHTNTVIQAALNKYGVEGRPAEFCISQILPDRELHIPDKANVFYAMNNAVKDCCFVVRKKSDLERMKMKHKKGRHRRKIPKNGNYNYTL